MPEPVARYQAASSGSIPASVHRPSSFLLVPLSSPREANGAPLSEIRVMAATASVMPAIPAGSEAGPTTNEVVVHDVEPLDAVTLGNKRLLGRFVMDEEHVGVTVLGLLDRLARTHGDNTHLDTGVRLEHG